MSLKELQPFTANKTTLQVKMFVRHSMEEIENEVNEWIAQKGSRIRHITQSQSEKQGKFVFVLSVFYETAGNN